MKIRCGFDIAYECPAPTPMLLALSPHPSRLPDLLTQHAIRFSPAIPAYDYRDGFGNICTRIVAPAGRTEMHADFLIEDSGLPDRLVPDAIQHPVEDLPDDILVYLLASRYCDTEKLLDIAWSLFGNTPPGFQRVMAITQFVHDRITFGYEYARNTRTAYEGYLEQQGVCRDFAHLAVTLCRCMNIPARYCTGYLGDIGVPYNPAPMDFSAWFEAFLGGEWHTFDARHVKPRIGRVVMARGRDATDVAIATTFGPCTLTQFNVITDEVVEVA